MASTARAAQVGRRITSVRTAKEAEEKIRECRESLKALDRRGELSERAGGRVRYDVIRRPIIRRAPVRAGVQAIVIGYDIVLIQR